MMFIITTSEKHRKYYLYTQLFDVLRGVRVSVVKDQVQNRCNTPPWKGAGTKRWNIPILAHPIKNRFSKIKLKLSSQLWVDYYYYHFKWVQVVQYFKSRRFVLHYPPQRVDGSHPFFFFFFY